MGQFSVNVECPLLAATGRDLEVSFRPKADISFSGEGRALHLRAFGHMCVKSLVTALLAQVNGATRTRVVVTRPSERPE